MVLCSKCFTGFVFLWNVVLVIIYYLVQSSSYGVEDIPTIIFKVLYSEMYNPQTTFEVHKCGIEMLQIYLGFGKGY